MQYPSKQRDDSSRGSGASNKQSALTNNQQGGSIVGGMPPIPENPTNMPPARDADPVDENVKKDFCRSMSRSALQLAEQLQMQLKETQSTSSVNSDRSFDWLDDECDVQTEWSDDDVSSSDGEDDHPADMSHPTAFSSLQLTGRHVSCLVLLLVLLLSLLLSMFLKRSVGNVYGVPIEYWCIFVATTVLAHPLFGSAIELLTALTMKRAEFCTREFPAYLHRVHSPAVFLLTTATSFCVARLLFYSNSHSGTSYAVYPAINQPILSDAVDWQFAWMRKTLECLLLAGSVWLAEAIWVQWLSIRFNERAFRARLVDSRFKMYVVDHLKTILAEEEEAVAAQKIIFRPLSYGGDGSEEDTNPLIGPDIGTVDEMVALTHPQSVAIKASIGAMASSSSSSFFPQRRLSSRPGNYALFKSIIQPRITTDMYHATRLEQQRAPHHAETADLARQLFLRLSSNRHYLVPDDFACVFADIRPRADAFAVFDQDEDGRVTKRDFRDRMLAISSEQRHLANSIRDTQHALERVATVVLHISFVIVSFISMWIWGMDVYSTIGVTVSVMLSLNLTISEPAKNFLLSVIFLFVHHCYTVGDRIIVGNSPSDEVLTVKHIRILRTTFRRWNGQRVIIPNFCLYSAPAIANLSRSPEQWESIDFELPIASATDSRLADLRDCLRLFVHQNASLFVPPVELKPRVSAETSKSETITAGKECVAFTARLRCRWTSLEQRMAIRHTRLVRFIRDALQEIGDNTDVSDSRTASNVGRDGKTDRVDVKIPIVTAVAKEAQQ